jgi:protein TonB
MRKTNLARLITFIAVAVFHILLILFFAVTVETIAVAPEQPAAVMKLMDFEEEAPPPLPLPPPPPPPSEPPPSLPENAVESIAETMIETDEVPEDQVVVAPGTLIAPQAPVQAGGSGLGGGGSGEEEYLPMSGISVPPVFSEREILAALVYPPIALRAGIEGLVYLELLIDRRGTVQQISILRETPANRGFGDAAANAFQGLRGKPAEANGVPVAVRYRYPVRFTIR